MTETGTNGSQTILSQYNAALEEYNHCIETVLSPIAERLQNQPKNAFSEAWTDPIFRDDSLAQCQEAKRLIKQIDKLVTRAVDEGIQLAPVSELEHQQMLTDLKRRLAWSLDTEELKTALEEASTELTKGSGDGTLQVLYEQATNRAVALKGEMAEVASSEQRSKELEDFMASLSTLDQADIEQLSEFSQIFGNILELNKKFHRFDVNKILAERIAGGAATMDLPEYAKESEKIRTSAIHAINGFMEKADQFSIHDPATAQKWFEPVKLFEDFLAEDQDAVFIAGIQDMEHKIADNLARWEKANSLLVDAKALLVDIDEEKAWEEQSFWKACQSVQLAEQAYKDHTGIDDAAKRCITHIVRVTRGSMGARRMECEQQWPVNEGQLVCPPDWEEHWLKNNDLPSWLKNDQQTLDAWFTRIAALKQTLETKLGNDCADRHESQINEEVSEIMDLYMQDARVLKEIVDRRKTIRGFIIQIQTSIRQGDKQGDQGLYQEAEKHYQQFLNQHQEWRTDVELLETSKQLLGFLSASQILKKACAAYRDGNWKECITDCETMVSQDKIRPLGPEVNVAYVSDRLQNGLNESLVAADVNEFARVLLQLAYVHQAAVEIDRCAVGEFFAEMDPYLKQIKTYGQGQSPIVIGEKEAVLFDDRKADYSTRETFGDNNILEGGTINELAIRYADDFTKVINTSATSAEWLSSAQMNLDHYANLDPLKQSLWVGDAREHQKELSNLFRKRLEPYLASLASSTPVPVHTTVEQAFSFLQTARRYGFYYQFSVSTRRWVTFNYFLGLEEKYAGDYPKICANWRAAVEDFSEDEGIVRKFRSVAWTWWLAELDAALLEMANGKDANKKLADLFNQNTGYLPDLFSPVIARNGSQVKSELDRYHDEIQRRQASQEAMHVADTDLATNPDSLAVVLRELEDAKKELNRAELDVKASNLAANFTKRELAIADGLVKKSQPVDAVEHYLRAYALKHWDGAQKWLENAQDHIRLYWQKLQDAINQFNEKEGSIYEKREAALQYSIRLEELRKCNISFTPNQVPKQVFPPTAQMNAVSNTLLGKAHLLDLGTTNLNRFLPSEKEWRGAANPKERNIVVKSSWMQLENYLDFLKSRFGANHQQVKPLSELVTSMKDNVTSLYEGVEALRQLFEETEEYGACLATCRKINDSVDHLCELEPQYHDLWAGWLSPEEQKKEEIKTSFYHFYTDHTAVYGEWKFRHGKRELPYYLLGPAFVNWRENLLTYSSTPQTKNFENQFEHTYQFHDEQFFLFISENQGLINSLRIDAKSGDIFLGNFLVLAYMDKKTWEKQGKQYDARRKQYLDLDNWFSHQEKNKITEMRSEVYAMRLCAWIRELQSLLKEDQPIAESAQKIRIKIAQAVRFGDNLVDTGELNQLLDSVEERIAMICSREETGVNRFYASLDEVNRSKVSDDVLNNITDLKRLYAYSEVKEDQRKIFDNLEIAIDQVEANYRANYKSRYDFFAYVEAVAQGEYA